MGYYIHLNFDGINVKDIDKEAMEKLNLALKENDLSHILTQEELDKVKDKMGFWGTVRELEFEGFEGAEVVFDEYGLDVEMEDYYQKFYDDLLFAFCISKVIKEGYVVMHFEGEEAGDLWELIVHKNYVLKRELEFVDKEIFYF